MEKISYFEYEENEKTIKTKNHSLGCNCPKCRKIKDEILKTTFKLLKMSNKKSNP